MSSSIPGEHNFDIQDWGRIDYQDAWTRQKDLLQKRINSEILDTLIFCEHNPVITMGRQGQREPYPQGIDLPIVPVERGGRATYHGPGQIVVYPIVQLADKKETRVQGGIVGLIRRLEEAVITPLQDLGINAARRSPDTGVWIDGERKIASIGIAAKRWVSYHGLALNINTDPSVWQKFNPCGFSGEVMTHLQFETERLKLESPNIEDFKRTLKTSLLRSLLSP